MTKTNKRKNSSYKASIRLSADFSETHIEAISAAFGNLPDMAAVSRQQDKEGAGWLLQCYSSDKPDPQILSLNFDLLCKSLNSNIPCPVPVKWMIEELPETDWLSESYKAFPPFTVGEFFIYGSHYDGDVPDGLMGLQIDAATAFGSGEHATTKGCLQAMQLLKDQGACPWNVLDMGTGSGILAVAAWKLWKTPVLAVDIDEESVRLARHHCAINKVPSGATDVTCAHGNGFGTPEVQAKKPFDLIIANILPGPLKNMAPALKDAADENGYIILSGILHEQAEDVLNAYQAKGMNVHERFDIDGWSTLLLHNPGA